MLTQSYITFLTVLTKICYSSFINQVTATRQSVDLNDKSNSGVESSDFRFEVIPAPSGYEEWVSPVVLPSPSQDGSQGWEDSLKRAKKFVSQMTLEEKINITTGAGIEKRCVGETGTIPRLGFNEPICLQDAPVGVRLVDLVSYFPAELNVASTFDRSLIRRRGSALGAEFAGKGIHVALGPMTNLMRSPLAGRNWEGFGADPFLSGVGSVETILGIQSEHVSACVKHFVGNEQEHYRGGSDSIASSSNIDDRTLRELYAWPFEESVRAGVDYLMCSYNRINQTQTCENSQLLNGLVKGELNFQGVLLSDWTAVITTERTALAGLDMNMPGFELYNAGQPSEPDPSKAISSYWGVRLIDAVRNGSVPMSRIDDMVQRVISTYYKQGQDKESFPKLNFQSVGQGTEAEQAANNQHVNVQADHHKLIREIGAASTILLKNLDQTLPLKAPKYLNSILILGSDAGDNPNGANSCEDRHCNEGTLAGGWGSGSAIYPYLISPATAIQSYLHADHPNINIDIVLNDTNYERIEASASLAELTIVHVNADSGEGKVETEGNAGDRNDLYLWHEGDKLILTAAKMCANTVVVIHSVGPVLMEAWIDHPNVTAVVYAGLPGQESGNAEVDILWGKVNPSARLPFTIAKRREDYPADIIYESDQRIVQINYKEKLEIDYRHFDSHSIEPRFEFGFGLSYTEFSYDDLKLERLIKDLSSSELSGSRKDAIEINFKVSNIGKIDGHEVPQLYLSFPDHAEEPPKLLKGFDRVMIKSCETITVSIKLRVVDISIWSVKKQEWVVPQGEMKIWVGSSSRDIKLKTTFTV
ncbi:family 3 glycoside hydrolase [Melampsora americana]|nr:family 3 glycoside hydrolase [Melampsora americana]